MSSGYASIYSGIASQRKDIASVRKTLSSRREQLGKPVVSGTAKQRRIRMRRVVRTPEHRAYVTAKKGELVALGSAEEELTEHEVGLGEYEAEVKKYETSGYDVATTDEGLQFTKETKATTSPYGTVVRTEYDKYPGGKVLAIHYSSGVIVYPQAHMINIPGQPFQKLPSYPSEQFVKLDEHTVVQRGLEDWYKQKQLLKTQKETYIKTPEISFLLEHADVKESKQLLKTIEAGPVQRPEGFIGPVQQPVYPAISKAYRSLTPTEKITYAGKYYTFGEEGKTWEQIKKEQPDWELKIKDDKITVATPLTDTGTLFKAMEKEYEKSPGFAGISRAITIAYASWFRPKTWVQGFLKGGGPLTGGILGVQPRIGKVAAEETLRWEYGITKAKDPLEKFVAVARPAYENVVLPYIGGAILGKAGTLFKGAKYIWSPGTKIVLGGTKVVVGGAMATVIGADIGYTAAMEQHEYLESGALASKLAKYTTQFAFVGAGYKWATTPRTTVPFWKKYHVEKFTMEGSQITGYRVQKYVDVFGKQFRYGKVKIGIKGYSFEPKPSWETSFVKLKGLAQGPRGQPTKVSSDITVGRWSDKIFVDAGKGWQPKTGIPKPGVYTGRQLILRPTFALVPKITGKIIPYVSKLPFFAKTESQTYLKRFFAKGEEWKIGTGIKTPSDVKIKPIQETKTYKDIFKKKPLRVAPKKPFETVTYKITPSTMEWQGKIWYQSGKGWQPKTGIPKPGVYTGRQLILRPMRALKVPRAYETKFFVIDFTPVVKRWFGVRVLKKPKILRFKPKKQFSFKDIVEPEPMGKGGTITVQKLKKPTIKVILEPPKTKVKTKVILESPETEMMYDYDVSTRWDVESVYDRMQQTGQRQKLFYEQVKRVKLDVRYGYGVISISKQKQKVGLKYDTFIDQFKIQKLDVKNILVQKQYVDMKYDYKMSYDFLKPLVTIPPYEPVPTTYKPIIEQPPPPKIIKPPRPPPPIYFELPEGKPTKKRKKKPVDDYGMGYRFRRWKVPAMKQIIGINNEWM